MRDDETDAPEGTGPALKRRDVLTLGVATAALAGGIGLIPATPRDADALPPPPGEEVLTYGFGVEIDDAPEASSHLLDLTFENLEITTSNGAFPKPKKVPLPIAHLTVEAGSAAAGELHLWWQEAAKGKCIRKNITVTLFKSDASAGRKYNLFDTFPQQWSSVNFDTSSTVQTETLTVKVGRIEFKV